MGTLTTNYKLLKVDTNGDDFVDVESQLDNNLSLIDDFIHRNVNYKFYDNIPQSQLPTTGFDKGDKLYSTYDHSVKVWNGSTWVNTAATEIQWIVVPYGANFIPTGGAEDVASAGYYQNSNTVYTRGIFCRLGKAVWTQGQVVNVFPAGSFPAPVGVRSKMAIGGLPSTSVAQWYQVDFKTDGSVDITKYGPTGQTAGSNENYVSINGLKYAIG